MTPCCIATAGKAEALADLAERLPAGTVPPGIAITRHSFEADSTAAVARVQEALVGIEDLAVRSSALDEDRDGGSTAGRYLSILGVRPVTSSLREAMGLVFASMASGPGADEDMVLVQAMVHPCLSSVVLTREPKGGGPYFVIAAHEGPRPDAVTVGNATRQVTVLHGHEDEIRDPPLRAIAQLARAAVSVSGTDLLDLEIIIDRQGEARLVQARQLTRRRVPDPAELAGSFERARGTLRCLSAERDGVLGEGVALSDMADWNPAEIVGTAPAPLAFSVYRELIGNRAWWQARSAMGYRRVPVQLLHRLGAHPYVDVRASLTSLVPVELPDPLAERVVAAGLEALAKTPTLHTQLEFELTCSCAGFDDGVVPPPLRALLTPADTEHLATAAARRTDSLILAPGPLSILNLGRHFRSAAGKPSATPPMGLRLHRAVVRAGVPFAAAARHAFAAERFLRGLVACEALASERADSLRGSVNSVATRCVQDLSAVREERLSMDDFLARYGHLRPGTYDIRSWCYRDLDPAVLLAGISSPSTSTDFRATPSELRTVRRRCHQLGMDATAEQTLAYIAGAIALREEGKLCLSWHVSELLEAIAARAEAVGLDRDQAALLELDEILSGDGLSTERAAELARTAAARHRARCALVTPGVILSESDLSVVHGDPQRATFVTALRIHGTVVRIDTNSRPAACPPGSIVCAERLDPGFEWLFSQPIAGLIVRYGGPNSHVAVRCHELGIPAVLGCPQTQFEAVCAAAEVELDCGAETLTVR